jgi:hypothetical protein
MKEKRNCSLRGGSQKTGNSKGFKALEAKKSLFNLGFADINKKKCLIL